MTLKDFVPDATFKLLGKIPHSNGMPYGMFDMKDVIHDMKKVDFVVSVNTIMAVADSNLPVITKSYITGFMNRKKQPNHIRPS